MKATKANFCTPVRDAITVLGFSTTMALNVVNSALGQVAKKGVANETTSDIKAKLPKSEELTPTVSFSVKESQKFEGRLTTPTLFAAWNDAIAKAEKLCPTMAVSIEPDSQFGKWLAQVAKPEPKANEVSAQTETVSK